MTAFFVLLTAACEQLAQSAAFLAASELLHTTAKTIDEETITVGEVQVITNEPHAQKNLEQMLGFQPVDKEVIIEKLRNAKLQVITFERERSQLAHLITRWQRHIAPKDQSEFWLHSASIPLLPC